MSKAMRLEALRKMLLGRYAAYRAQGLAGVAPYARVDSGPMKFSQIKSPERPSRACTVLLVFER